MKIALHAAASLLALGLAGCSTTQQVTLAKVSSVRPIATVAKADEEGNSPQMDDYLKQALEGHHVTIKESLPPGTRKAAGVDAVVSYSDVWPLVSVTYLKSVSIYLYDARSGDLLVIGEWSDSRLHGYRDAKLVVQNVVDEMFVKLGSVKDQGK